MNTRSVLIGLLGVGAVWIFASQSWAPTCALRSSSGSCLFWSGSVAGDPLVTDSEGSLTKHPVITLEVTPTGAPPTGVIACANQGSHNTSPGIQTVFVLDATSIGTFLVGTSITKGDVKNGIATLTNVLTKPIQSKLDTLVGNCPNSNWTVVDFVPCSASITVALSNDSGGIDSASFPSCTLDYVPGSCAALQFNQTTQHFNRQQYLDPFTGAACHQ